MEPRNIGSGRRIVKEGGDYKIQSRGVYSNSPTWATIVTLTPHQLEEIVKFKNEESQVDIETEKKIHCSRCGVFNDAGSSNCKSCKKDITGDPVVERPAR